jgi:4-hydroxy-tetrahydrodipicolinate synthase
MTMQTLFTRRDALALIGAGAVSVRLGAQAKAPGRPLAGALMILHTPFTAAGEVDWEDLAREAEFVDRAGAHGIVWPQGSSGVAMLTKDERLRGMELLVRTMRGRRAVVVLGVQGRDTGEMLAYTRRAEELGPDALIAMPPSSGTSLADYEAYFRALAGVATRPVIVQTTGGRRDLPPSVELIVSLAREFRHFGFVKEESDPVVERMKALVAARPPIRGVFGATFGTGWLYEMRLGLDGVITGNAMYADLMARIWSLHRQGARDELLAAFSTFLLMRNAGEQIPGTELYIFKKRGLFKTTVTRRSNPADGPVRVSAATLDSQAAAEIDERFAALAPYLIS